jgi:metal-responsive CopG/Arc/MetJ family transcriptional regulator
MRTITLPDSLAKEIDKAARALGYTEKSGFVEHILKEKLLEYKRHQFMKGVSGIQRKLAKKNITEDEILADFERFRHSQSRSSAR